MRTASNFSPQGLPYFWVVLGDQSSYYVGHDESRWHRFHENLHLCHLSFKLLLLDQSPSWVPPELKDDTSRPCLGVALFDISISDIDCRYIDTFKNIDIDIDIDILENIDIDKEILENIDIDIDIDKEILENIDIDKILNQLEFGISNRAR